MFSEKRAMTSEDFQNIEVLSDPHFITPSKYSYVSTTVNKKKNMNHIFMCMI